MNTNIVCTHGSIPRRPHDGDANTEVRSQPMGLVAARTLDLADGDAASVVYRMSPFQAARAALLSPSFARAARQHPVTLQVARALGVEANAAHIFALFDHPHSWGWTVNWRSAFGREERLGFAPSLSPVQAAQRFSQIFRSFSSALRAAEGGELSACQQALGDAEASAQEPKWDPVFKNTAANVVRLEALLVQVKQLAETKLAPSTAAYRDLLASGSANQQAVGLAREELMRNEGILLTLSAGLCSVTNYFPDSRAAYVLGEVRHRWADIALSANWGTLVRERAAISHIFLANASDQGNADPKVSAFLEGLGTEGAHCYRRFGFLDYRFPAPESGTEWTAFTDDISLSQ